MYSKPFFIEEPVWNNVLSFDKRQNKKLFVTNIINAKISEIEKWSEVVFEDFDFNWVLKSCSWLKNFYRIKWIDKEIVLFDNHNHAFYFWYEARKKWQIWDNNLLIHIDEHSDMRNPEIVIKKPESEDLKNVFDFTNYSLNVWNYIVPALEEWIISEIIQIRNETNLIDYLKDTEKFEWKNIILNLDLDFFSSELDYIDYELKKKVVLDVAKKARVITVATSPFFINQDIAINVFKDLFN